MESFLFETMLPRHDISTMLMSPGANKQDIIRFDNLVQGKNNDGIRITAEPQSDSGQPNQSRSLSIQALDQLDKIENSTQDHISHVMETLDNQKNYDDLFDKKRFDKMSPIEITAKLHHEMQRESSNFLKAQMHMNLFSVTITMVNRVANSVNEGLKTLYRQQG